MKLLEELRNLDVGNPGRWSAQVSAALACCLFLLLSIMGLRVRVFGQLAPRLEYAKSQAAELDRQLAAARNDSRAVQALVEKTDRAEAALMASTARIPAQAQELDLPVSLAARQDRTPLEAVRPWAPQRDFPRDLEHVGAELELGGDYRELIAWLEFALKSGELRELVGLNIESQEAEERGRLRAAVRLVSYFGGGGAAQLLRNLPEDPMLVRNPELPPFSAKNAGLPSPFGVLFPSERTAAATQPENSPAEATGRGYIQVGDRRYRLVEDAQGRFGLRSGE